MSKIDMLMFYLEFAAMHLLNFAHPLTDEQKQKTEALLGQPLASIRHIPVQVDTQQPLAPQVRDMVENIDLSPKQWQSAPILWEYGQKQARQSGQAPSYQHHGHVQQTTTSRADGDALKRMQREASRQQQQTLAQASYQHREVERARIISVSDSAFEVSLSKIENKSYQVKKKNRFRSYQIGAKIRVRILVNANGEITRVEEV